METTTTTLTPRDRQRAIRSITTSVFLILLAVIGSWQFIAPRASEIDAVIADANTKSLTYATLNDSGPALSEVPAFLERLGVSSRVDNRVFDDTTRVGGMLAKEGGGTYVNSLDAKMKPLEDRRSEEAQIRALVASVVPTLWDVLNPEADAALRGQLTLESFVDYVEKKILQKYRLKSSVALGFDGVVVPEEGEDAGIVGITLPLDVTGESADVMRFLKDLQTTGVLKMNSSGALDLSSATMTRSESGTTLPALSRLDNLLIQVNRITLAELPNLQRDPTEPYSANIEIVFYVQTPKVSDIAPIVAAIRADIQSTKDTLNKALAVCRNAICSGERIALIDRARAFLKELDSVSADIGAAEASVGTSSEAMQTLFSASRKLKNIRSSGEQLATALGVQ